MSVFAYIKGRLSNIHVHGNKPDIFIISTARSGSTLLMELLYNQRGVKIYDEPLNINYPAVRRELQCNTWEEATLIPDRKIVYRRYFNRLRKNRIPELNIPIYRKFSRFVTSRNVFKVIHGAEDIIHWLQEEFNAQVLILVRHPIPTALSHKQFQRLPFLFQHPEFKTQFTREQIEHAEQIIQEGSHFEKAIVNWCIQNRPFLVNGLDNSWCTVSYEDLTMFPEETFRYMQKKLQLESIKDIDKIIRQPSGSTVQSDKETKSFFEETDNSSDRKFLINKWRRRISSDNEKKIFETLELFDIDFYEYGNDFPAEKYRIVNN